MKAEVFHDDCRTGWMSVRHDLEATFGKEMIDRTMKIWGIDASGELCAGYRPSGQSGVRDLSFHVEISGNSSILIKVMVCVWKFQHRSFLLQTTCTQYSAAFFGYSDTILLRLYTLRQSSLDTWFVSDSISESEPFSHYDLHYISQSCGPTYCRRS